MFGTNTRQTLQCSSLDLYRYFVTKRQLVYKGGHPLSIHRMLCWLASARKIAHR